MLGQGMQTGRNDVFELDDAEARALQSDAAQCLKRRARNSDIEAFQVARSLNFLLYVEDYPNFASLPARIQRYLTKHRRSLEGRAAFIRGNCVWWKYSWPLNKGMYNRVRLICPYRATKNRFAEPDDDIITLTDTTCVFVNDFEEGIDYLMGLLNSAALTFRFFGLGKLTGKNMYEYFDNAVARLPIRRIEFHNLEDVRRHDQIAHQARIIREIKVTLAAATSGAERASLARSLDSAHHRLDLATCELYGLNEREAAHVLEVVSKVG